MKSFQPLALIGMLLITTVMTPSLSSAQANTNPRYIAAIKQAETAKAKGQYKEAAEAFRRAMSLEPKPEMLYDIALMYQQAKEERLALQYFKDFVDQVPADARVADAMDFITQLQTALLDQYQDVLIKSQPEGAYVYIDSRANGSIGETPIKAKLLPGEYQVIAELDGYVDSTEIITVKRGAQTQVSLALYNEESVAPVTFMINRADAKIYVDKRLIARSPLERALLISQGTHTVRVMLAGYAPWEQEVKVSPQRPMTLDVVLTTQSMDGSLGAPEASDSGSSSSGGVGVGPLLTMGFGALLLGGSAYTGFSAQRLYTQLDELKTQGRPIASEDLTLGDTFVMLTNVLIGAGVLSLSAGGAWWAMSPAEPPQGQALSLKSLDSSDSLRALAAPPAPLR